MKKTITFLASLLFVLGSFAQTEIEILPQYGSGWGGGVEVDVNNNGHLDLLFGGIAKDPHFVEDPDGNQVETHKFTTLLMYNPATQKYESKETNILNADRAHFAVADFNGDGIMDLVITEHARDVFYKPGIYEGVGDGTFIHKEMTFDDETYEFRPVSAAVADFNNDGLVDIVAIGYERINEVVVHRSAVLINKGDYNFAVTNTELLHDYELALVTVKVLDHNNDGYMDFFVSGNVDNPASNNGARVISDIFENLGTDEPGAFFRLFLGDGIIFQKANGGLDIADFDGDGWLDFALHGEGGAGTGEPTPGDIWACISRIYINQKNGSYLEKVQPNFSADLRPLNSSGMSTRAIDWNGNGSPDLFIGGWNPAPETGTQAGFYWLNDGAGNFGSSNRIPGASEIFILFPDWNGNGVIDYFMSGQSWDNNYFPEEEQKGRTAAVMLNNRTTVNQRPTAPTGLSASVDGSKVVISWNAATDAETSNAALSYEYYMKKGDKLYNSVRSHVGGDLDGARKVLDLGNAMMNKSITLYDLPDGVYEWGVQAIDASYEGSVFANGTFTVGSGVGVENVLSAERFVSVTAYHNTLNVTSETPSKLQIFTITGAMVQSVENVVSYRTTLPTGFYIVRVTVNNQPVVRKVIIK